MVYYFTMTNDETNTTPQLKVLYRHTQISLKDIKISFKGH